MIKENDFRPAPQGDAPKLLLWLPGLPIALVQGRTKNYLVNYEVHTCTCPDHQHRKHRNCRHIAYVVGLVPLRAATEPHQYAKGLCL